MPEAAQSVLRKVIAVGSAVLAVAALSAISVVRADNRNEKSDVAAAAGGNSAGGGNTAGYSADASTGNGTDAATATGGTDASGSGTGATTGGATAGGGTATAGGGKATAAGGGGAQAPVGPSSGTNCADYNPNIGVFCDHFLVGGTTVLSGPLAVYGDQGL